MRFPHQVLTTAFLCLSAFSAGATPADPKNGVEYLTLDSVRPTQSSNKVEVVEFFGYFCPHCYAFDPALEDWVKKQGNRIVFKRMHTAFGGKVTPQQRFYYTLEAMGKAEELHKKIFNAIHVEHRTLNDEASFVDFVVKQGIDKNKFLQYYNSFSVQTEMRRATQLETDYKLGGVPHVVIGGRFVTAPAIAVRGLPSNQPDTVLQSSVVAVMDMLVGSVGKEQAKAAKPVAASAASKAK